VATGSYVGHMRGQEDDLGTTPRAIARVDEFRTGHTTRRGLLEEAWTGLVHRR